MCPKLIELLSWNGPTVHVCCFMSARASTKTFVCRVQKTAKKISVSRKIRYQGHSLAEVSLYCHRISLGVRVGERMESRAGHAAARVCRAEQAN